jgi:glycosyltransferase involved in cell wall biosynthesis
MILSPQISIITPVWNGWPYIKECVESVLSQDFESWEMIISDNGSTDETRAYLDSLADERIRVFKQDKNLGIFGNLNFLVSQPSTPLLYILCADDYFLPGGLGRIVNKWDSRPSTTSLLRFNWMKARYGAGKSISYHVLPKCIGPEDSSFYFYLFGCIQGNLSNVSVRTSAIASTGKFNEQLPYAGDYEYWIRLGRENNFELVEDEVCYIRRHPNVASNYLNRNGELVAQNTQVRASLFQDLKGSYPLWLLRLHGTWRYLPMIEVALLRSLKSCGTEVLLTALKQSKNPCMLFPVATFIIYLLTLGGRLGRHRSTYMLLKKHRARLS